jgi:hypothetical protein
VGRVVQRRFQRAIQGVAIMKKFILLAVTALLGLAGFGAGNLHAASTNTSAMLIQFQITALVQKTVIVTNGNEATTTYTTTTVQLGNQNILNLLQAEFSTTFPAGAQLAYSLDTQGFYVLDQTGNSIMNVSTNPSDGSFMFNLSNSVAGATSPEVLTGKIVENIVTTNETETASAISPDYGIYYQDSHGNNFHLDGLLTIKLVGNVAADGTTTYSTVSFTIVGSGGGTFFNPDDDLHDTGVFTKAKVTASGKDVIQEE